MRGDFSRQTFRPDKHFNGVLMQQGRVQLDADFNEQQAINRHLLETTGSDVIGPTGAPKVNPGFEIKVSGGTDIQIGKGHFYVDGVLCENDADVLLNAQPDLRATSGSLLPQTDGLYLAYLETWERHLTALEDDMLKEPALAGPDTTTRSKAVWQVRLLRVTDPGGTVTCATVFPEWTTLRQRNLLDGTPVGRMSARAQAEAPSPDPLCILPPSAGYRRLENQLYRVEVHTGGNRTQARFKWSRDNGTVASRIVPAENGAIVDGSVVKVAELGKDGLLTFASDPLPEWLELTDDRFELEQQRGTLARVQAVDAAARTITFAGGGLPALSGDAHPIVRRWDQAGASATADGVAMTGTWQQLEDGVEVRFGDGTYRQGDYWLIPARTALGLNTGSVQWPLDGAAQPKPLPPDGVRHRVTRLALVRRAGSVLSLVPGTDCRRLFAPLTAIKAVDVGFDDGVAQLGAVDAQKALERLAKRSTSMCSLLVSPGDDLAALVAGLGQVQDALICLRVGTYTLTQPLQIQNRRHIQIAGAGPGTRVVAAPSQAALRFTSCETVKVSNLHVDGPLTFLNCESVSVEGASVRCAGGPDRQRSCVSVYRTGVGLTRARITGCALQVGHLQTGILVVGIDKVDIAGNLLRAEPRPANDVMLADPRYRGRLRPHLISAIGQPANVTNATVTYSSRTLNFRTDGGLVTGNRNDNEWQRAINLIAPSGITTVARLERFLLQFASRMLMTVGTGPGGSQRFATAVLSITAQDRNAAGQGIAVVGNPSVLRIEDNTIDEAHQGIHVAIDNPVKPPTALMRISGNAIVLSIGTSATRERHGVFVATASSLALEGNFVSIVRTQRAAGLRVEGIRIVGLLGRKVIVRDNHLGPQFAVGVTFAPFNVPPAPLWIITENIMESASAKIDVPKKAPGIPGAADPDKVRGLMRGLGVNFA